MSKVAVRADVANTAPEAAASEAFRSAREEVVSAGVAFVENEDADFEEAAAESPAPLLLLRAKHEGTPAHEKATRQAQLRYKAIDDSREALREKGGKPSLWKQYQAEHGEKADFNELLLNMGEARTAAKKFSPAVRPRYLLMLRNLNLKPSEDSAVAATKRVHWSVVNTAADIEEAEELSAPKVILSREECTELLSRPRTLAKATGAVRRAERFMFLLLWLLFVTGGRCENLWNAGPVRFLKDRVLVHWRRRKGGRHHPRCATPYLYSWTDLPPTPEILATIEIVKEITSNRQAIPWSSLTGDGGNLPAQKVTNWMAKLPMNLTEREGEGKITSKCARDYFVNRLFKVAKEPGSRLDTNMYQLIADHTMTTALISYIDLNLHFPEEDLTWAQETLSKPGLFEADWLRAAPPSGPDQEAPGATVACLREEIKHLRRERQGCEALTAEVAEVRKLLQKQEERIRRLEDGQSATPTGRISASVAAESREWERSPSSPRSRQESGGRGSPALKTARSSGRRVASQQRVISSSDDEDPFAFCADVNTSDEEGA